MNSISEENCAICGLLADTCAIDMLNYEYWCKRCGNYIIDYPTKEDMSKHPEHLKGKRHLYSAISRHYHEFFDNIRLTLNSNQLKNISLHGDSMFRIPDTVEEKIHVFMLYAKLKTEYPSKQFEIDNEIDYPVAFAKDKEEFSYYLQHLKDCKWIIDTGRILGSSGLYYISIDGWKYLSTLNQHITNSKKCFVAMNFNDKYSELYKNGIEPAIKAAGFDPILIKDEEERNPDSNRKIDDRIISEIKEALFIVADFSGQKQNVYYEAGLAKGLGKKVIHCCVQEEVDSKKLHFDTRNYPHIVWDWNSLEEFKRRLENRIKAEIK